MTLSREQWLQRFEARLVEKTKMGTQNAFACSHALPFEEISLGFENDPEGAADEEIVTAGLNR